MLYSFRFYTVILAALVALFGIWSMSVSIIRAPTTPFPIGRHPAETVAAQQSSVHAAALLASVRGDLWADYGVTLANDTVYARNPTPAALDEIISVTHRAIVLAPHESRAWLLLAAAYARSQGQTHDIVGPVKMSYFTAPSAYQLMPLRLAVVSRSKAIDDPDVQVLLGGDIREIILRHTELRSAIISAYRDALPDGRRFIQTYVASLDPRFAEALAKADYNGNSSPSSE
jgi:hypothetical protein